jgi:hypothetical protein
MQFPHLSRGLTLINVAPLVLVHRRLGIVQALQMPLTPLRQTGGPVDDGYDESSGGKRI